MKQPCCGGLDLVVGGLIGAALVIAGVIVCSTAEEQVQSALTEVGAGVSNLQDVIWFLPLTLAASLVFDVLAMFVLCLYAGQTRHLNEGENEEHSCFIEVMLQTWVGDVTTVLITVALALHLVLSCIAVILGFLLLGLSAVCRAGGDVLSQVSKLLKLIDQEGNGGFLSACDLELFCGASGDIGVQGLKLALGLALGCAGQATLLACVSAGVQRRKIEEDSIDPDYSDEEEEGFCRNFRDGYYVLPLSAGFAFFLAVVGVSTAASSQGEVEKALVTAGSEGEVLGPVADWLNYLLSIIIIVDIVAMAVCFLAAGHKGECVMNAPTSCSWLVPFGRCLAGPCSTAVIQVIICLTVALQMFLSFIAIAIASLLALLSTICAGSDAVLDAARDAVDKINKYLKLNPHMGELSDEALEAIANVDFDTYCALGSSLTKAGIVLCVGCMITVVSQVVMNACVAGSREHLMACLYPFDFHKVAISNTAGEAELARLDSNSRDVYRSQRHGYQGYGY